MRCQRKKYDAVLLDISLPDRNGLDILREIKNKRSDLPVVMLTMHPEAVHAIRALRAGASGYVTKRQAPVELIAAIRKVANGEMFITSTLADQILLSAEKGFRKSTS